MRKPQQSSRQDTAAGQQDNALRCCCGSLLARVVSDGVEIKCRRCKRCMVVPFNGRGTMKINI